MDTRKVQFSLALIFAAMFAVTYATLLFRTVPDQNRELVSTGMGFMAGWIANVMGFYFGTTTGSEAKTETIANQAKASVKNAEVIASTTAINPVVVEAPASVTVDPGNPDDK